MASRRQHQLNKILDRSGPGTYNEEAGCWSHSGDEEDVEQESNSGWSFFGFKSNTVETARDHLRTWAKAIQKRDSKSAQAEQKWFNDNDWTSLEMRGSPPFYSRMVWKSNKFKKKIGVTISNDNIDYDPTTAA